MPTTKLSSYSVPPKLKSAPIESARKTYLSNVATHLPITKGERIHFYQNSIPPCKGILRCVARLLYHETSKKSIQIGHKN